MSCELAILKDFLDHEDEKDKLHLMQFISSKDQEILQETPSSFLFPSKGVFTLDYRLSFIHYTWWISFLDPIDDNDKYLFLAALPEMAKTSLLSHYSLTRTDICIKNAVKDFFQSHLYENLTSGEPELLYLECLPPHPLNDLLLFSRDDLLCIIDLLSIHDLAIELKTLIRASHLTKIYQLLSEKQKGYFQTIRQKKEFLAFTPMGISRWSGDEPLLKKILHQRGLNRLAKALSQCHPSLIWHLLHKLDTGRAASVQALIKDLKNKKAHDLLVEQVCDVMNMLSP